MASSTREAIKAARIEQLMQEMDFTFIYFKGADLMSGPKTHGFINFDDRKFGRLVQSQLPGTTENMTSDLAKTVRTIADDWSEYDRYVAFNGTVWDRQTLTFVEQSKYVYSTDVELSNNTAPAQKFLLQLANGDKDLAYDYLQAMAPIFMMRRPTGVIWFLGEGANGKSTLLNALDVGFKKYFKSQTTADLEDGRDLPSLQGILANIVKESSDMKVTDSKVYKSLGSHEETDVHVFNKQTGATIKFDFHAIFNANNIPVFGDKTSAITRRTWLVPFPAKFEDNPSFEEETFKGDFIGGLFRLILDTAVEMRDRGNKYVWSEATLAIKREYDQQINSADAYGEYLISKNILGVYNYAYLKRNYSDWCSRECRPKLGIPNLKRALKRKLGLTTKKVNIDNKTYSRIFFDEAIDADDKLVWEDGTGYGIATPTEAAVQEQLTLDEDSRHVW